MNKGLERPFELKSLEEDGTFEAIISTFGGKPDSYGDIINRGAFLDTLAAGGRNGTGVVLGLNHKTDIPVGGWLDLDEIKKGLHGKGRFNRDVSRGSDAYYLVKAGDIKHMSFAYDVVEYEADEKRKIRYLKKLDLWEAGPVTFPANTRAIITGVKKAKTKRDLETALREVGLSISDAKYIASHTDLSLREVGDESKELRDVLLKLQNVNELFRDEKGVIPFKSYPTSTEDWNGPAEIRGADVKKLRVMCTWFDSKNSDVKSAYKLPHHKASNFYVVWNGVTAAMGALLGARGGVDLPSGDRRGVYNHLAKHYKQFDKEPPTFK